MVSQDDGDYGVLQNWQGNCSFAPVDRERKQLQMNIRLSDIDRGEQIRVQSKRPSQFMLLMYEFRMKKSH